MRFAPFSVSLVLAAASLAFAPCSDAAEVYKWTDADGVTHYADAPPDGQKYERMRVGGGATTAIPDPAPVAPAAEPAADGTPETQEQAIARFTAARAKNCEIARANLAMIESSPDVQKDSDGDGVPEPMTAEQRTAEVARNQDLVARSCAQ